MTDGLRNVVARFVSVDEERAGIVIDRSVERGRGGPRVRQYLPVIMNAEGEIPLVRLQIGIEPIAIFTALRAVEPRLVPVIDLNAQEHAKNEDDEVHCDPEPILARYLCPQPFEDHAPPPEITL